MVIQDAIRSLVDGGTISGDEASAALEFVMSSEATPAQIGAFLTAMRSAETPDVIAACLKVTQAHAEPVNAGDVLDVVGTGADGMDTFNVSTAAAIVAAGAGVRVAKHGNRAATSKCGSADVLEALGGRLDLSGEQAAKVIDGAGFCFLFAQRFHPSFRHVGPARKEIGIRTIFNVLGPLTNPAAPSTMLVGSGVARLAPVLAQAFLLRGLKSAMVVHSAEGLDEISPSGPTKAWRVAGGAITEVELTPTIFGLPTHPIDSIRGGGAEENAATMRAVFAGEPGPVTDFVLMNTAAALVVAGKASDYLEGVERARDSIASGRANKVLEDYVRLSNEVAQ